MQFAPSAAPATCLTQTSKPTVALPSGRCSKERIAELRSIIAIIPGVESTLDADRAADVGEQPVLDRELVGRARCRARAPSLSTIPIPPETPSVSPVT